MCTPKEVERAGRSARPPVSPGSLAHRGPGTGVSAGLRRAAAGAADVFELPAPPDRRTGPWEHPSGGRRLGAAHRSLLAHDLAQGDIVFDERRARARDVSVELLSLSKTFHLAGQRIGLVAGGTDIVHEFDQRQDHLVRGSPSRSRRWPGRGGPFAARPPPSASGGAIPSSMLKPPRDGSCRSPLAASSSEGRSPAAATAAGLRAFCWVAPT